MENAVYIGLSQQIAMQRQMDVIANNLANANTPAYRGERVMFQEYLVRSGAGTEPLSFVQDYGTLRDVKEGELKPTGNPLDIALNGKGFLTVSTPDGERYTRNGHLRLNAQGELSTPDGDPVLDDRGQPIRIDMRDGSVTIADDGTISNSTGTVARLKLVNFDNQQDMRKVGGSLYATSETPKPPTALHVQQGMIESSNVEPIVEMTNMLQLLRNYQSAQQLMQIDMDRQRQGIERLAKVG